MASIQYAKISVEDDDEITRDVVKSPWNSKGILGRMTWSWFSSVIDTGKDRPLQLEDLPQLAVQDTAEEIIDIPGLFAAVQSPYIAAAVFAFIYYSLQIGSAIVVRLLILELIEPTNEWIGYTFACALGISALLQAILLHQFFFLTNRAGTRARTLLSTALFKKLLLVKQGLVGSSAINLISNDTYKIEVALGFLLFLVAAPLLGIAVASLLYLNLGVSGLVGVGCMFLNVPLQIYFSKKITAFRKNTSKFTDSRTQSIKEFLKGIQVIKMYNWENPLAEKIDHIRDQEIQSFSKLAILKAFNFGISFVSVTVSNMAMFSTFIALGNAISPEILFSSIYLVAILQYPFTTFFPAAIEGYSEMKFAYERITNFLKLSETESEKLKRTSALLRNPSLSEYRIENASFSWSLSSPPVLKNINIVFPKNKLTVVLGKVGSGKTSLLCSMIRELELISGDLDMDGVIAYSAQKPWLFAGSIRENVLLGREWDSNRYNKVLYACELEKDIAVLGDTSSLGERGASLSGGQRARVALARAIYGSAEMYLFDDSLSAVDAAVGARIAKKCFSDEGILNGTTRVLVTHQSNLVNLAERIIVLDEGSIIFQGTRSEFLASKKLHKISVSIEEYENNRDRKQSLAKDVQSDEEKKTRKGLIAQEERVVGSVGWSVYKLLLGSVGSAFMWTLLVIFTVLTQLSMVASDFWLSRWSQESSFDQMIPLKLYIYIGLCLGTFLLSNIRTQVFFLMMIRVGRKLHDRMLNGIFYTKMVFFESNPLGRILNRFTKDVSMIDEFLPSSLWDVASISLFMVAIITVLGVVNPIALVSLVIVIPAFILTRRNYVKSSREIKRVDGITKSPIVADFSSAIDGLVTIRAFKSHEHFLDCFLEKLDSNNQAWYSFLYASRWVGFRVDIITTIMLFIAANAAVFMRGSQNPALVAFALVYVMRMTSILQWMVRQSAEVENQMTSLERVKEYCELPSEKSNVISITHVPDSMSNWPSKGEMKISELKMRYRPELDLALNGLDVVISSGEKIGVCGRTGAGKSSLFTAFYRLCEYESGTVFIDGIDISQIPLDVLRNNIIIIPQEPVMFSGTIRSNLDPFGSCSDEKIWEALEAVQLKEVVQNLENLLETQLEDNKFSFSIGQSQLICIARAIIRPSKILLVDEATANVDSRTDKIIQSVIRSKFSDRTVITIAHRLNTIIDSDKILVMDAGKLAEFDTPKELIKIKNGKFKSLLEESGTTILP